MSEEGANKKNKNFPVFILGIWLVLVVIVVFAFFNFLNPQGFLLLNQPAQNSPANLDNVGVNVQSDITTIENLEDIDKEIVDPANYPNRADYFRAVFSADKAQRDRYKLFERASVFLGKDLEEVKTYFGLTSEEEIFEAIPPAPKDFGEIAYLFNSGNYYGIGFLEEEYFLQPELYSNFKSLGLKCWTQPDPRYWTPSGYGSLPSEQFDTLKMGERAEFTAVVFVHAGWCVQTYQGFSLEADPVSKQYFDIEITPKNFLLGPAWPKFSPKWVYKVEIRGKLKPGTPPGSYKIGINVMVPPRELEDQWFFQYKNIYFNAATAIRPVGNFIQLNIGVEE